MNKCVLVYDYGLCLEVALKMAEKFDKVLYYVPWQDAFPSTDKALIGDGFQDQKVFRINSFWDYVDEADLICFFDTYTQDIAEYLRLKGYRVFAPGFAEFLETDRLFGREIQRRAGLPTQKTEKVIGVENLREYLKQNPDVFVKINAFRGTIETFYSQDYESSKVLVDYIASALGMKQDTIEFVIEQELEGIEPGYDGFVVDGQYPNYGLWGYEMKGTGYIAKLSKYEDIPEPIKKINDGLSDFFKQNKTRSFFSTEVIVTKDRQGYLIDPTVRSGMPCPTAVELEMYSNLPEFIWNAADGKLIDLEPIPGRIYGAGVALDSDWANEHWLEVNLDESIRPFVKFRRVMKRGNKYYSVPGFSSICSVIGFGKTVDEAIEQVKENLNKINAFELSRNIGGLSSIKDEIEKGEKEYGLRF